MQVDNEVFLPPASRGDRLIRFSISRNTVFGIAFSLVVHALLIFMVVPRMEPETLRPASPPIQVTLAAPDKPDVVVPPSPEPPVEEKPQEKPKPVKKPVREKIVEKPSPLTPQPPQVVQPEVRPEVITTPKPSPEKAPPVAEEAPTDMASYVKAQQAKRQGTVWDAARQNAEAIAREQGPSEAQLREERIKRNFQNGVNGIFEVTSLDSRRASFAFMGWTNDYSNPRKQYFEVEARAGQDVRLVMIRRMISLIREHYQGDFNWNSHRLGQVIVLSARPEDNSGLEDFMMTEFFGPNYKFS